MLGSTWLRPAWAPILADKKLNRLESGNNASSTSTSHVAGSGCILLNVRIQVFLLCSQAKWAFKAGF